MTTAKVLTIGIDATNLRGGGGITHLVELLRIAEPAYSNIERIVVWAGISTLKLIEDRPWLDKRSMSLLDNGLLHRTLWQILHLSESARKEGCDLLFVPGGSYTGNFHPVVIMSQNLLPFDMAELKRYGWVFFRLKLLLLRLTQSCSFKKADGIIFLTEYASEVVLKVTGKLLGKTSIVPHGLSPRFNRSPKIQRDIAEYNDSNPYRVLYVSIVDQYKHQWHVVEAIATLRKKGFPVVLDLVGPAYTPALMRLNATIDAIDFGRSWVHYHGAISFDELHHQYAQSDLGLFASSCENMPNILLETMASGLPIACSKKRPMPEILGRAGIYFDPEEPDDIARALCELIESPNLRAELSEASYATAQQYSWQRCADETFSFLNAIVHEYKGSN